MRIHGHQGKRRGAILVCVLACLLVATTLAATSLQTALRMRRESRNAFLEQQTEWLLKAGVERARAKYEKDQSYLGEQWDVPESVLTVATGKVLINRRGEGLIAEAESRDSNHEWLNVTAQLILPHDESVLFQLSYRVPCSSE